MTAATIPQRLVELARRRPHDPAYGAREGGAWVARTWREVSDEVDAVARGLLAWGLAPGEGVAILGSNRREWVVADLAAMAIGALPAGIYDTDPAADIALKVEISRARVLILESPEHWQRAQEAGLPREGVRVVAFPGGPPDEGGLTSWEQLLAAGAEVPAEAVATRRASLRPEQGGTLIFTSGTTGQPKAVLLTHDNLAHTSAIAPQVVDLKEGDVGLSYLPLSHIAEQMFSIHVPLTIGGQIWFVPRREDVPAALQQVAPSFFFGVPRVWEKFYAKARAGLEAATGVKAALLGWARGVASRAQRELLAGRPLPPMLAWQHRLARRLVFSKLRQRFGLHRARILVSGAAPLGVEVLEFFASLDMPIHEVYGQSEGSGPTTFNTPGKTRFGTVGQAIPGVQLRIAEDGEVLARGRNIFAGYHGDPAATAETLVDGWLHTGDLGTLDEQGFLTLIGRKKELIVTAGGKNIAPKPLEEALKEHPLVEEAVVIGDERPYLIALLVLEEGALAARGMSAAEAAEDAAILAELEAHLPTVNARASRAAGVKALAILPRPLSVEAGELTPTLKIKRSVVANRYAEVISAVYQRARPPGS